MYINLSVSLNHSGIGGSLGGNLINHLCYADDLCLIVLIVYRPGYFTVHPPPRLQVDQNFLTQKIVADPKMRCHQKSFGIWRVTEAILGQKTCFFSKNIF